MTAVSEESGEETFPVGKTVWHRKTQGILYGKLFIKTE